MFGSSSSKVRSQVWCGAYNTVKLKVMKVDEAEGLDLNCSASNHTCVSLSQCGSQADGLSVDLLSHMSMGSRW